MTTIIRANDVARIAPRLAAVDLSDHLAEAKDALERARSQAKRILDNAKSEAARLGPEAKQIGYDEGYAEGNTRGYAEGKEQGKKDGYGKAYHDATEKFEKQHGDIVADFNRLIEDLSTQREALFVSAKRDLLEFAVGLATQLTYRIGGVDHQSARANLGRALNLVRSKRDLTIRAHPDDLAAIEEFASSVLKCVDGDTGVVAVSDETIDRGGCVVRSEAGEVDATLATQIGEIVNLLLRDHSSKAVHRSEEPFDG